MGIWCMSQGNQTGLCDSLEGSDGKGDGREVWEGGDMVTMVDPFWCLTENNKIL